MYRGIPHIPSKTWLLSLLGALHPVPVVLKVTDITFSLAEEETSTMKRGTAHPRQVTLMLPRCSPHVPPAAYPSSAVAKARSHHLPRARDSHCISSILQDYRTLTPVEQPDLKVSQAKFTSSNSLHATVGTKPGAANSPWPSRSENALRAAFQANPNYSIICCPFPGRTNPH